jgi:hypothetical protein
MGDRDVCPKHDDCLGRIHTDINAINIGNAELHGELKAFMKGLEAFKEKAEKAVYDKDGLIESAGANKRQLTMQWGLILIILAAIVGLFLKK